MVSDIQAELRLKGKILLGDKILFYGGEWMLLRPGDTYLAHADGGKPEMLTVRRLEVQKRRTGMAEGKVFPKERKKKLYNLHEVVKVTVADNNQPIKEKQHDGDRSGADGRANEQVSLPGPTAPELPRTNRPIPRDPGRAGRTDYRNGGKQPAADASPSDSED